MRCLIIIKAYPKLAMEVKETYATTKKRLMDSLNFVEVTTLNKSKMILRKDAILSIESLNKENEIKKEPKKGGKK